MRCLCIAFAACLMLVGCQKYPNKVHAPALSETVAEGKKTLRYTADTSGVVFLQRSKRHQMVWRCEVNRGDQIVVDLERLQLFINGHPRTDVDIELATYRLMVERS